MSTAPKMSPVGWSPDETTFKVLVEHWGKARVEVPLQLVARFDEAGKQLVTIGSTLQTLYIALFITSTRTMSQISATTEVAISICLWLVIVLAGLAVCSVQVDANAIKTFKLFGGVGGDDKGCGSARDQLWHELDKWCKGARRTVWLKRGLLTLAKISLIVALGILLWVLPSAIRAGAASAR